MQMAHSFSSFIAPKRSSVNLIFDSEFKIAAEELILFYLDSSLVPRMQHTNIMTTKYMKNNKYPIKRHMNIDVSYPLLFSSMQFWKAESSVGVLPLHS